MRRKYIEAKNFKRVKKANVYGCAVCNRHPKYYARPLVVRASPSISSSTQSIEHIVCCDRGQSNQCYPTDKNRQGRDSQNGLRNGGGDIKLHCCNMHKRINR